MKRAISALSCGIFALSLTGCATNLYPGGATPSGLLFSSTKSTAAALAVPVDQNVRPLKTGSATATAVLGLVAFGDASVTQAMKTAGITTLHHVDYSNNNVLGGLYLSTTIIVYGE